MRYRSVPPLVLALIGLLFVADVRAQDVQPAAQQQADTPTHLLRLRDGSSMLGWVVADSAGVLRFRTQGGVLEFPRTAVAEVRTITATSLKNGEYWFPDPNATRLFFAPTGRTMRQGEGYFSDSYLFLTNIAAGVTDNVTLAGGMTILPTSNFLTDNAYYFTPKVGVYSSANTNVAVGAFVGYIPTDNGHSFGVLYGVTTFGQPDAEVTLGAGYGYADGTLAKSPTVMVGGSKRVGKRVALVTENYLFKVGSPLGLSYGARFFGEKLSVDLGFINSTDWSIFPGVPYVSFAVNF